MVINAFLLEFLVLPVKKSDTSVKYKRQLNLTHHKQEPAKHKTRCRCTREEEEGERSSHRDNTNVLMKEFEMFIVKRFGKQISLLIIGVNELKSESTIFDKLPNEVMSNLCV